MWLGKTDLNVLLDQNAACSHTVSRTYAGSGRTFMLISTEGFAMVNVERDSSCCGQNIKVRVVAEDVLL